MAFSLFGGGRVLALYDDGLTLHGAVVSAQGRGVTVDRRASTPHDDTAAALDRLLARMREGGGLPKRVALGLDRAALIRAELPVAPDRPRAYAQMRELARWETEPAFSDLPSWSARRILTALGHLDAAGAQAVDAEIARRGAPPGRPAPRFQDVALELALIDRAARDAAARDDGRSG